MRLISIIVPIYNVENYLAVCLDSIVEQTYKNLEIILVDDGSTDNSLKICRSYADKDKRIKVVHKSNGGVSSARNYGIDISQGELIAFVDPDDFIELNMYEKLEAYQRKYNADMVSCNIYNYYVHKDNKVELLKHAMGESVVCYNLHKQEELKNFFEVLYTDYALNVMPVNKLYRRSVFAKLRYPYRNYEDTFICMPLLAYAPIQVFIPDILYYYRRNRPGSIMTDYVRRLKQGIIDWEHVDTKLKLAVDYKCWAPDSPYVNELFYKTYKEIYDQLILGNTKGFEDCTMYINRKMKELQFSRNLSLHYRIKIALRTWWPFRRLYILYGRQRG